MLYREEAVGFGKLDSLTYMTCCWRNNVDLVHDLGSTTIGVFSHLLWILEEISLLFLDNLLDKKSCFYG